MTCISAHDDLRKSLGHSKMIIELKFGKLRQTIKFEKEKKTFLSISKWKLPL